MSESEIPQEPTTTPEPETEEQRREREKAGRLDRIRDMINMDIFLQGAPYKDEWSIGGVRPRWPTSRHRPSLPDGPVISRIIIDTETGEMTSVPLTEEEEKALQEFREEHRTQKNLEAESR